MEAAQRALKRIKRVVRAWMREYEIGATMIPNAESEISEFVRGAAGLGKALVRFLGVVVAAGAVLWVARWAWGV